MGFGKPNYGATQRQTNWIKLKEGADNVFRILPPYGSMASAGKWAVYHRLHYGYKNSKGKMVPFQSTYETNFKTKMVEVPDAAVERIEKLKAAQKQAKDSGNKAQLEVINAKLKSFNLDKKWYMNVVDLNGNVGVIKIPHRMKQLLDAEINKYKARGIDPVSAENGRFFVFRRTGTGPSTVHSVSAYLEPKTVNGVTTYNEPIHSIDDSFESKVDANGFDIGNVSISPTPEEIELIVKMVDPKTDISSALDEIEAKYKKTNERPVAASTQATTATTNSLDEDDLPMFDSEEKAAPAVTATPAAKTQVSDDALFRELGI